MAQIIRDTWDYDRFCSSKTAEKLAKAYLYRCLADQTYTQVALVEDPPVGIVMAKNAAASHHLLPFGIKSAISVLDLLRTKEGRAVSRIFMEVEKIDQELLRRCPSYDGELAFFAVSEACRGMGLGKALFEKAVEYLRSQGISSFYLFTDTSCNYGFYEHQGMQQKVNRYAGWTLEITQKILSFISMITIFRPHKISVTKRLFATLSGWFNFKSPG